MQGPGLFELVVLLIYILVVAFPVAKILGRLGFSPWWTILAFIPLVNVLALWVLAYARWTPREAPR